MELSGDLIKGFEKMQDWLSSEVWVVKARAIQPKLEIERGMQKEKEEVIPLTTSTRLVKLRYLIWES